PLRPQRRRTRIRVHREERGDEHDRPGAHDQELAEREAEDARLRGDLFFVEHTVLFCEGFFGEGIFWRVRTHESRSYPRHAGPNSDLRSPNRSADTFTGMGTSNTLAVCPRCTRSMTSVSPLCLRSTSASSFITCSVARCSASTSDSGPAASNEPMSGANDDCACRLSPSSRRE